VAAKEIRKDIIMIFGECPYDDCNEPMVNAICDNPPMFQRLICEKCGRVIWLYHSRIDPVAYTEDGLLEKYEIDETTKSITEKVTTT
jgi:hypothetical protein